MSSGNHHEYLKPSDIRMLGRVLTQAGFQGAESEVYADAAGDAARFVIKLFQTGMDGEADLMAALDARGFARQSTEHLTPNQVKAEAIDRWNDKGGS